MHFPLQCSPMLTSHNGKLIAWPVRPRPLGRLCTHLALRDEFSIPAPRAELFTRSVKSTRKHTHLARRELNSPAGA